jgi:hypothetical protein
LPLLLITLALFVAAVASYGTDPAWGTQPHGMDLIYLTCRLQLPLFGLCLILCAGLVFLVVAKRRRAWWLIGLLPVLVLFGHRFATSPMREFRISANPAVADAPPQSLKETDYVVGLTVDGQSYAYPYACLYQTPVVVQTLIEQRLVVLWNPYANFARAFLADRDLKAQELEVVSMPANALLVYNSRYGEFINGVTGRTRGGKVPTSFGREIEARTVQWGQWRTSHPNTKVVLTADPTAGPTTPLLARYPLPGNPPHASAILLSTTRPTALIPTDLSDRPANLAMDGQPTLAFRDPATGEPRAFSRIIPTGEELRFAPPAAPNATDSPNAPTKPVGFMAELATGWPWSAGGTLLELKPEANGKPDWKGLRLTPIPAVEGPNLAVLKFWIPDLVEYPLTKSDFAELAPPPSPPPAPKPPPRRRRAK